MSVKQANDPTHTSRNICLLTLMLHSLKRNAWMRGGGLVKLPHKHKHKRTQINAQTKKENKQGAGVCSDCHTPSKMYTKKVNHAVQFHCRVLTREVINLPSNKRGETTEHYAQAATHYPSLLLSTHTQKSVKTHHDNIK